MFFRAKNAKNAKKPEAALEDMRLKESQACLEFRSPFSIDHLPLIFLPLCC